MSVDINPQYVKSGMEFVTSDLSLVAALRCFGASIQYVDKTAPRAVFYIRREAGIDELVQAFFSHTLQVDPLTYFNALKEAKSRLYGPPIR